MLGEVLDFSSLSIWMLFPLRSHAHNLVPSGDPTSDWKYRSWGHGGLGLNPDLVTSQLVASVSSLLFCVPRASSPGKRDREGPERRGGSTPPGPAQSRRSSLRVGRIQEGQPGSGRAQAKGDGMEYQDLPVSPETWEHTFRPVLPAAFSSHSPLRIPLAPVS